MKFISKWFNRGAEFIVATMLAAMFLVFLVQIASRYSSKLAPSVPVGFISDFMAGIHPLGWTVEFLLVLWLWIVFFGNAFVVRDKDHVTFDILYLSAPKRVRKVMALTSAAAMVAAMAWAFLPTWDYIDWLKIRKAATLRNPIADWGIPGLDAKKIPLRTIFSIYGIFMVAVIARYTWRFIDILRKGPPDDEHELIDHDPKGVAIQHGDEAK